MSCDFREALNGMLTIYRSFGMMQPVLSQFAILEMSRRGESKQ